MDVKVISSHKLNFYCFHFHTLGELPDRRRKFACLLSSVVKKMQNTHRHAQVDQCACAAGGVGHQTGNAGEVKPQIVQCCRR